MAYPSQPAAPTVAVVGNTAVVSWTAPANGGTTITCFEVTALNGSTAAMMIVLVAGGGTLDPTPGAADSYPFSGLSAGNWTFTVAASNDSVNYGPASPLSAVAAVVATEFTVGYLVDRTFDLLLQAAREERNQLQTAVAPTDTTLTMNFPLGAIQRGTYLAVDDEVMYVWATSPGSGSSSTATVNRGDKGTVASPHTADAIVYVDPYFTRHGVRKVLQDEIRSWGPQVFQVKTTDISATEFVRGYDLGNLGPWFSILDITESPDDLTGILSDSLWKNISYSIMRSANTASFPSGNALMVTDPLGVFDVPRTFHLVYAAPIDVDTTFSDTDSLVAMGLDTSDLDIPPYGAAWRLASGREVRRMLTEAQGENADLQNYPPGYALKAAQEFKALRDSRLSDAVARLRAQYPLRRTS